MSRTDNVTRPADAVIRAAVDAAIGAAPAPPPLRAMLERLAQELRPLHPSDWEKRVRKLWALALRAGEVWSPEDGMRGLERMLSALIRPEQAVSAKSSAERLEALVAAQGVQPIDDPASLVFEDWPEDESVDDFIAAVREWRRETPPTP